MSLESLMEIYYSMNPEAADVMMQLGNYSVLH